MNRLMIILGCVVAVLGVFGASAANAPSCAVVYQALTPCLAFLRGNGEPSSACCSGVKGVAGQIQSKEDRQAVCECLKDGLSRAGPYDSNKIPQLPAKCGASINLPPITPSTNCATAMAFNLF